MRNSVSCRAVAILGAAFAWPVTACAQETKPAYHHEAQTISPNDLPIKITINPEERVSVVLAGALPKPAACGTAVDLPIRIVNQGFATVTLEARFVGDAPTGVALDFHPKPLKGVPEELRSLRITLSQPGPTDLTIAFKARHVIPDLGGRDRIHFLMNCKVAR
jgi:hypothetical protein